MSHPFIGKRFTFTQPDGTQLKVLGWGDQNAAVFETQDGYTICLNPETGYYEYAEVTSEGEAFQASGIRPGAADAQRLGIQPHLGIRRAASPLQAEEGILPKPSWKVYQERARATLLSSFALNAEPAPPLWQTVGDCVGLCLLVRFPDPGIPVPISRDDVEAFCNQPGYRGFHNKGSVYDYFLESSIGRFRYTTLVAPYYTARECRDYYRDPRVEWGVRARELVLEALEYHKAQGFDFSSLSVNYEENVRAVNLFYVGEIGTEFQKGLWPHASSLIDPHPLAPGMNAFDYQITNMGDALSLGGYCHENGHMICGFPDLYDLGKPGIQSFGIGAFCLMSFGGCTMANEVNPTQICAYLKFKAGWANSVTWIEDGLKAKAPAGTNDFFIHARNETEYFIIENRHKSGRDQTLPSSGLAIWHIDETGDNDNDQMSPTSHFECSLEQADGLFQLERGKGKREGDSNDLYRAGYKDEFGHSTVPSSNWWDGTPSGLEVQNISSPRTEMTFTANLTVATMPAAPKKSP